MLSPVNSEITEREGLDFHLISKINCAENIVNSEIVARILFSQQLGQETTERFRHFARVLFSRNFASDAKFRENKTLAKISECTVLKIG